MRTTAFLLISVAIAVSFAHPVRAERPRYTDAPQTQIHVLVLNGTHRAGLAARVDLSLARRGFVVQRLPASRVANAPPPARITRIYFYPTQPQSRAGATELRQRILGRLIMAGPPPAAIDHLVAGGQRPELVLVLGSSYVGLR